MMSAPETPAVLFDPLDTSIPLTDARHQELIAGAEARWGTASNGSVVSSHENEPVVAQPPQEPEAAQRPKAPTVKVDTAGRMGSLIAGQRTARDERRAQPVTPQAEPVQAEAVEPEAQMPAEGAAQSSERTWPKVAPTLDHEATGRRFRDYAAEIDALPIDEAAKRLERDQQAEGDPRSDQADWYLEQVAAAKEARKAAAALAAAEAPAETPSQSQEQVADWSYDFEDEGKRVPQGRRVGDDESMDLDLGSDIGTSAEAGDRSDEPFSFESGRSDSSRSAGREEATDEDPMAGIRQHRGLLSALAEATQGGRFAHAEQEQGAGGEMQAPGLEPGAWPAAEEKPEIIGADGHNMEPDDGLSLSFEDGHVLTKDDLEAIRAIKDDEERGKVYESLTEAQWNQIPQLAREISRGRVARFLAKSGEWIKANPTKAKLAAVALVGAGVATFFITKDFGAIAHLISGSGGHGTGATPTPTGTSTNSLVSQAPTVGPSSSPSAIASASPSAPSGGSGNNSFNDALNPRFHKGGNVIQPPAGGGNGAPSAIDRAIQINNEYARQHNGQTQPLWASLHAGGYTDTQIANALDSAERANVLTQHAADGGGYFVRLTSNNSDNPIAVMQMLKTQGFLS